MTGIGTSYDMGTSAGGGPVDDGSAPVRPGPRTPRSWGARLITWPAIFLLIVGTVALGNLIKIKTPIGDDYTRPFFHNGQMNQPVDGNNYTVTVESVRGGRVLSELFDVSTTNGVYVLVKVKIVAHSEEVSLQHIAVVDAKGNTYDTLPRFGNRMQGQFYQPDVPIEGEMYFEVPTAAATNLRLQLSRDLYVSNNYQVIVQVPLKVTESQVTTWFRDSSPLTPMNPEVAS